MSVAQIVEVCSCCLFVFDTEFEVEKYHQRLLNFQHWTSPVLKLPSACWLMEYEEQVFEQELAIPQFFLQTPIQANIGESDSLQSLDLVQWPGNDHLL